MCVCVLVGIYSTGVEDALLLLTNPCGGVTHLAFSPCGKYLFAGERKVSLESLSDCDVVARKVFKLRRIGAFGLLRCIAL